MRKGLLILVALALVALAVGVVGPRLVRRPSQEAGTAILGEESQREEQTLITARGIVVPERWAELSFAAGGRLEEINATSGMTVTAGQVLATLERQELELQVQLAESELEAQQATLAQLTEGASQAEIDAARASYTAAVSALEELKAGPSAAEVAIAEADLKMAERAVQRAQAAYDAVQSLPDIGARPEALQLEAATVEYQRAKAAFTLAMEGSSEAGLRQAESQVASAKAQLEALTSAQPSAIRAAEASVTTARIALSQAQLRLEEVVLAAPFDGTVTTVADVLPGQVVDAGQKILTIADLGHLQVEVTDLDEWGAANLTLNPTADLIVPALGNRSLRGKVDFVSAEPTLLPSGAVFYKAIITLETQDPDLRWGNSVRIRLYTAGARGVGFR